MNKDKIIKDLKERNDKLTNQYRLRDIRCVHLEIENTKLKDNWNKLKEWLEEESKLKGSETAYLYYGRVKDKMQEIEGGMNE